jgi:CRP-like cAMP-binding protein
MTDVNGSKIQTMDINDQQGFKENIYTSSCFSLLLPEEQKFLSDQKTQLEYEAKENIFKQGAFAPYVIYILEGLVKVYIQAGPQKHFNIRLATGGDFLGFSTVFGDKTYNYSTIALKNTKICMYDKDAIRHVLSKNVNFAMQLTAKNFRIETHLLEVVKNISYKQMRGKLASVLIYLSSDEFRREDVFHYLSRNDIADFASISPESTIRFLKEFEKEKIIKLEGRNIEIINLDKLKAIGEMG